MQPTEMKPSKCGKLFWFKHKNIQRQTKTAKGRNDPHYPVQNDKGSESLLLGVTETQPPKHLKQSRIMENFPENSPNN